MTSLIEDTDTLRCFLIYSGYIACIGIQSRHDIHETLPWSFKLSCHHLQHLIRLSEARYKLQYVRRSTKK